MDEDGFVGLPVEARKTVCNQDQHGFGEDVAGQDAL